MVTDSEVCSGPLKVHPCNPRHFADETGNVVYVTGSHTWSNLQEFESDSPFDYAGYLDFMVGFNHNFMRMWAWECGLGDEWMHGWTEEKVLVQPLPHKRTKSGKFDLNRHNQEYFDRLRARVLATRKRGIYVSVMLFQGWDVETKGRKTNPFDAHPFNKHNNINGIDGDPSGTGEGMDLHTLKIPAVTRLQEAYVRKVLDTLNDLDNVLYEISNESHGGSVEWHYHMINFIHEYEKNKPKQHPVGMTFLWSDKNRGSNEDLFESPADWVSPNPEAKDGHNYAYNPPPADGRKVVLLDTDHLWGLGGDTAWAWKAFLRGYNPLFMDPYDTGYFGSGRIGLGLDDVGKVDPKWDPLRRALGYVRGFAEQVDLAEMTPHRELTQTGYCLANPGVEYLVYLPSEYPARIWVDLSDAEGKLNVKWFNPRTGSEIHGGSVTGGARHAFRAPFSGDAVLHIREDSE